MKAHAHDLQRAKIAHEPTVTNRLKLIHFLLLLLSHFHCLAVVELLDDKSVSNLVVQSIFA